MVADSELALSYMPFQISSLLFGSADPQAGAPHDQQYPPSNFSSARFWVGYVRVPDPGGRLVADPALDHANWRWCWT
jgi:hypothetical protein